MNKIKLKSGGVSITARKLMPQIKDIVEGVEERIKAIPKEEACILRNELIKGICDCVKKGVYSYRSDITFSELTDEIREVIKEFEDEGYEIECVEAYIVEIDGYFLGKRCKRIILTIPN